MPEALWQADDVALLAIDRWLVENYYGARAGAERAQFVYDTLKTGVNAYNLRDEIVLDAVRLDANSLWRTDDIGWEAVDKYLAGDYVGARASAEQALFGYTVAGAGVERQRALDARADIAVRQGFNSAQAVYVQAASALQGQRQAEASRLYTDALYMFRDVANTAWDRRLAAEDALRRAEQRLIESDQNARNAESILEGGR